MASGSERRKGGTKVKKTTAATNRVSKNSGKWNPGMETPF